MRQLTAAQADDLYELVSERQGRSLIITSNRAPSDWYPLFPNPVVAESLLDRLINTSHQVIMNGPSYRPNKATQEPRRQDRQAVDQEGHAPAITVEEGGFAEVSPSRRLTAGGNQLLRGHGGRRYSSMGRNAEVIVLALWAEEVMEPLMRPDPERTWDGRFAPLGGSIYGWFVEFDHVRPRSGLLKYLESLPWPMPESVQVLIHDEEDDCFGLWMLHDGRLVEVPIPRTRRAYWSGPPNEKYPPDPGILRRTDCGPINWPEEIEGGDHSRPKAW